MATVLPDTDVVSYLLKGDTRAAGYAQLIQGQRIALSFMSVAELFQWASMRKWGTRRISHLEQTIASYVVVPADLEMCRIWGRVRSERQSTGQPISPQDAWIAATALLHNLPLLTHNANDFANISGLDVRTSVHP